MPMASLSVYCLDSRCTLCRASGESRRDFWVRRLDDGLLRNNDFSNLSFAVLIYADCGLVDVESNTVRNCSNGFVLLTLPTLAYMNDMANVSVEPTFEKVAVYLAEMQPMPSCRIRPSKK